MELDHTLRQFREIDKDKILLSFHGVITPEFLSSILQIFESKLNDLNIENRIKKKAFNIFIECAQNLYHHIEEKSDYPLNTDEAYLLIFKKDSNLIIKTGNFIEIGNSETLSLKLDMINNLDKDGLKKLYLEALNDGNISNKGTAGLGFIDMVRKSEHKLKYEFVPVDKKYNFFSLEIKI